MCVCVLSHFSHAWLFVTLWSVACQAPLSTEFSRQEYWSRLPCPPPRDFSDPGIEPESLMSPSLAGRFFTTSATWEAPLTLKRCAFSVPVEDFQLVLLFVSYCLHFLTWRTEWDTPESNFTSQEEKGTQYLLTTSWAGFRGRNLILFLIYATFPGKR